MTQRFRFFCRNNERLAEIYGRTCIVLARGSLNSCLVAFENGEQVTTSRFAIRKIPVVPVDPVTSPGSAQTHRTAPQK